ncbi:MAG TPA: hypothetical protein VMU84_03640 [Thermoanaerobaculia bacterium]|nr:hypothetical protein [Thermoanaerobaculia bacterium]
MKTRYAWSAFLALLVVAVTISIRSDLRHNNPGEYGKLNGKATPTNTQTMDVVEEAPPVADQTAADPMLVAPAAREQYLHANTNAPAALEPVSIEPIVPPMPERHGNSRYTIVGGPEGVTLIEQPRQ